LNYFGARYYDSDLGRWTSVDPLADKYPGWSPFNYTLNNPLKYIDPDGFDVKDVQKLVKAIHNDLNKAWKNSFNNDGTVQEVSGAIVSKNGNIYAKNIIKGSSDAATGYDFSAGKGETLEGNFHTHPYSQTEGGYTGIAASGGDIIHQAYGQSGAIMIIESGTQRFALEITDIKSAQSFMKNNDIQKMWDTAFKNAKGTFQERVISATSSVVNKKGSGFTFYQSTDKDKKKFEEVR